MAIEDEWAQAYLRQARVELEASRADLTESVRAMLLQMVFEKVLTTFAAELIEKHEALFG